MKHLLIILALLMAAGSATAKIQLNTVPQDSAQAPPINDDGPGGSGGR